MRNLRAVNVPGNGPEDTLFDAEGNIYCSLRDDGCIVRVIPDSGQVEKVADTGGAPLGLDWLPDGQLLVCNAPHGLLSVNISTGAVSPIQCDYTFGVCNNAHVLADGTIIVSDSSSQYSLHDYQKDIVENTASGRLVKVTPDGVSTVLMEGLSFANGVVCINDGATVLVAETGTRVIKKVSVDGGVAEVFALPPGHPDNMSIGSDGNVWVAIPSLPSKPVALLHKSPVWLRRISSRLPEVLQPKPELCCRVIVYDSTGNTVQTYNGDTATYNFVTGVRERDGRVAMGSIGHSCIGIFET